MNGKIGSWYRKFTPTVPFTAPVTHSESPTRRKNFEEFKEKRIKEPMKLNTNMANKSLSKTASCATS